MSDICVACNSKDNQKYWALGEDGLLYYIGQYGNYEEADIGAESMKVKTIWLVDQETANSWHDTLTITFKENDDAICNRNLV